jgi:hypothetical protein
MIDKLEGIIIKVLSRHLPGGTGKNEENFTTVGVQAEVRTENLPITRQECYCIANLKFWCYVWQILNRQNKYLSNKFFQNKENNITMNYYYYY